MKDYLPARQARAKRSEIYPIPIPGNQIHKGWYSRGYLPHFDSAGTLQTLTFSLADSIPTRLQRLYQIRDDKERRAEIESALNRGHGSCILRRPECARIVEEALLHFDTIRYRLTAWVIMPNHVHVIFRMMDTPLEKIVSTWKGQTASAINRALGRSGSLWAKDYFDRFVRDQRHLDNAIRYVHQNPVKARLTKKAADWEWSSIHRWKDPDAKLPRAVLEQIANGERDWPSIVEQKEIEAMKRQRDARRTNAKKTDREEPPRPLPDGHPNCQTPLAASSDSRTSEGNSDADSR